MYAYNVLLSYVMDCVGVSPDGDWKWGGCADNVQHGYKKSREFMDAKYRKRSDLKTQVMLHNNEAGRLVNHFCCHIFVMNISGHLELVESLKLYHIFNPSLVLFEQLTFTLLPNCPLSNYPSAT